MTSTANSVGSERTEGSHLSRQNFGEQQLTLPLALEDGRVPELFKSAIYACGIFLIAAVTWMVFGQIRELAVAKGSIVPAGHIKLVHHLEGGQVEEVLVTEGQTVEKGTPILRLRPVAAASDLQRAQVRAASLGLQLTRLNALIHGNKPEFGELESQYPEHAENQMKLFNAEASLIVKEYRSLQGHVASLQSSLDALLAQKQSQARRTAILKKRVKRISSLFKQNVSTSKQLLDAQLDYEKELSSTSAMTGNIARARAELARAVADLQGQKRKDLQTRVTEHSKLMLELAELRETITKQSDRLQRLSVHSPAAGVVQKLSNRSAGEVIPPGGLVAEIVPSGTELVAHVQLDPKDIGHIQNGDKADLKISTYDPNVYGTIQGTVRDVSPTTIQPSEGKAYYNVVIALNRTYLGRSDDKHHVVPGMEVQADVITGSKSIMTYLFRPIHQSLSYSFTER